MDVESVKREGFNQHGILVVAVEDQRLSWIERQIVKQLGERIYGQK
jgi:acetolactate synthase small subunit